MFKQLFFVAALLAVLAQAFVPQTALPKKHLSFSSSAAATAACRPQQQQIKLPFLALMAKLTAEEEEEARKLTFQNNQRSRKGRTTDEDGKSNIWAYDRKEEVEVGKGNGIIIVGVLIALFLGALTILPTIQFPSYD
jgi:predicted transglutaminase-like cysteine proteinase